MSSMGHPGGRAQDVPGCHLCRSFQLQQHEGKARQGSALQVPCAVPDRRNDRSSRIQRLEEARKQHLLFPFLPLFKLLALFPLYILLSVPFFAPLPVGDSLFLPLFPMILFVALAAPNSNSYSSNSKRLRLTISLERFCPIHRPSSRSGFRQAQPFHNNTTS